MRNKKNWCKIVFLKGCKIDINVPSENQLEAQPLECSHHHWQAFLHPCVLFGLYILQSMIGYNL